MSDWVPFEEASWRERLAREGQYRAEATMRALMAGQSIEYVRWLDLEPWAIARDGYPTAAEDAAAFRARREYWASERGALLHGSSAESAWNDGGAEAQI